MFPQPHLAQRTPDLPLVKIHVFKQASVKTDANTTPSSNSILQCENNKSVGVVYIASYHLKTHTKSKPVFPKLMTKYN